MTFTLMDITSVLALAGGVASLLAMIYMIAVKMTRLEVRVNTMWDFLMRRALSEAIERGIIVTSSHGGEKSDR